MTDQFKVGWIPAKTVITQVINLFFTGDVTKEMSKRNQMGGYSESI